MPPLLIALGVAAIYWFIKGNQNGSPLNGLLFAAGAPGITTNTPQPATTADPATIATATGTVTNQPGTSGSGVPSTSSPQIPYQNPSTGFSIQPGMSMFRPFFSRSALIPPTGPSVQIPQPMSPSGRSGCCGCARPSNCGSCGHADGRGSCQRSLAQAAPGGKTLQAMGANIQTIPDANLFNVWQQITNDHATINSGDVPAAASFLR